MKRIKHLLLLSTLVTFLILGSANVAQANNVILNDIKDKIGQVWKEIRKLTGNSKTPTNNTSPTPQTQLQTVSASPDYLSLKPNQSRFTKDIDPTNKSVNVSCKTQGGCNLIVKVMESKKTPDNYSFYSPVKEENIQLGMNNSIDISVGNLNTAYILNFKNVGSNPVEIDYELPNTGNNNTINQSPPRPSDIPPLGTNNPPIPSISPNPSKKGFINLGRIIFNKPDDDSYIWLISDELSKGSYRIEIVPSTKRGSIAITPVGKDVLIGLDVIQGKSNPVTLQTLSRDSIRMDNPLVNYKGGTLLINVDVREGKGRVFVLGL